LFGAGAPLTLARYFHGSLTAYEAEDRLRGKPKGTFLLRFSSSEAGGYALATVLSPAEGRKEGRDYFLILFFPSHGNMLVYFFFFLP
jgi:hypothetical protein